MVLFFTIFAAVYIAGLAVFLREKRRAMEYLPEWAPEFYEVEPPANSP